MDTKDNIQEKNIIPKIIHYCWFGKKEIPDLAKNALSLGKSIVLIMKSNVGMNQVLMSI